MSIIEFLWPWLFLLLPAPWLVPRLLPKAKTNQEALTIPFSNNLKPLLKQQKKRLTSNKILAYFAWGLLITACANPVWLGAPVQSPLSGRNLLLAIDISGSMKERDMQLNNRAVSRLTIVKQAADHFIASRPQDRIGLILFGSRPYLRTPLTFDHQTLQTMLDNSEVGLAGPKTAIGDAIGLAIKTLLPTPANSRVLVLLTDGTSNAGALTTDLAADLAKQEQIKIYTIGLGASQMAVQTPFGMQYVNPSQDLDSQSLQQIAKTTGGQFFRAQDLDALQQIYQAIDTLEPSNSDHHSFRPKLALYQWPLGLALLLSVLVSFNYCFGSSLAKLRLKFKTRSTEKLNPE